MSRHVVTSIFTVIIIGMFSLLWLSASVKSQTIDEGPHIAAGYSYWVTGDWRMNPEHPPLVKLIAGAFIAPLRPSLPLEVAAWQDYNQWDFGRAFIYDNIVPADRLLWWARLPIMLISLLLVYVVWRWTSKNINRSVGILAALFVAFEPNILAHSRLVTTDVPLTLTFFLAIIAFAAYLKAQTNKRLLLAALAFALALATKYSALLLIPILLVLWLIYHGRTKSILRHQRKFWKSVAVYFLVTSSVIWAIYGFQVQVADDDPRIARLYEEQQEVMANDTLNQQPFFVRVAAKNLDPATDIGGAVRDFLENAPIPAYSYWRGFFSVFTHNQYGHSAYLLGQQSQTGWWYYFPIAFAVKVPLAISTLLIFAFMSSLYIIRKRRDKKSWTGTIPFTWYILTVPIVIYGLFSVASNINLGVRHLLPMFPFILIIAAWGARKLWQQGKIYKYLTGILLVYFMSASVISFPHYLSYFNEITGGPAGGHKVLLDSNLDWGQDLALLARYLKDNNISKPRVAYFGSAVIDYYIPDAQYVPEDDELNKYQPHHDFIAISAGVLYSIDLDFEWLKSKEPTTILGNSIYIYDLR
jgi:4-amino-4-deoxy-L-arabinose transferase-like glycosyltransferase